jgi:hypothetical protein
MHGRESLVEWEVNRWRNKKVMASDINMVLFRNLVEGIKSLYKRYLAQNTDTQLTLHNSSTTNKIYSIS